MAAREDLQLLNGFSPQVVGLDFSGPALAEAAKLAAAAGLGGDGVRWVELGRYPIVPLGKQRLDL